MATGHIAGAPSPVAAAAVAAAVAAAAAASSSAGPARQDGEVSGR